jgi:hypothetical protein
MLETLRKHDRNEAQRILSGLTAELLPNPEIGIRAGLGVDPDLHTRVWAEIRRRAKVDPADTSPAGRGRLFEFLFSEMSEKALSRSTLDSVKARLSFKGELRSDLYEVRFNRGFSSSEGHGVRQNHVLEAIRNADDVEHLNLFDDLAISFFLRTHNDFPGKDPFVLLVLSRRIEAHVEVTAALRIYRSDVDITTANRPSDILRLLVNKYGFLITIGEVTAKLIFDKIVTVKEPIDPKTTVKVHALEGSGFIANALWQKAALHSSWRIAWAFALDQARYAADLRKHGVHVKDYDYTIPTFRPLGETFF